MTIRLTENVKHPQVADSNVGGYIVHGQLGGRLAITDTPEEAEQAKRAFELVLAPRLTRDEAIAIVKKAVEDAAPKEYFQALEWRARSMPAVRAALEALAAAGAFVDGHPCPCEQTDCPATMSAKLDAAGIR